MQYYSCPMIENFYMNFNGRIDTGSKCITICCEPIENMPRTAFYDTPEKTIRSFQAERENFIAESKQFTSPDTPAPKERYYTAGCAECANFQLREWPLSDGLIHYVNLSMYPAPCQSKCFYCGVHSGDSGRFSRQLHTKSYKKMFDALDWAIKSNIIAPNARWQVSSGEIAIHPYRERILDLVKDRETIFFTNCFKFDEDIAANLGKNPRSAINLSIDSGTPETWLKIKGVDNFDTVTENLVKYFVSSMRPGQITLKYIMLPGINDNYRDYFSAIEIMKVLKVPHLEISRDTSIKYSLDEEQSESLIRAVGYLAAMLHKNGMSTGMFTLKPKERERVAAFASAALQAGEV